MSLFVKDTSTVPTERWWIYVVPETNFPVKTKYYINLYPEILKHCAGNNVSPPSQQTVIDYICANQSVPCIEAETREPLINKFTLGIPKAPPMGCCGGGR